MESLERRRERGAPGHLRVRSGGRRRRRCSRRAAPGYRVLVLMVLVMQLMQLVMVMPDGGLARLRVSTAASKLE